MLQGYLETRDYQHFTIRPAVAGDAEPAPPAPISFEGAKYAAPALPGDLVIWNGVEVADVLLRSAEKVMLVGTLELSAKVRYGMTSRGAPVYRFTPYSEAYPPFFVGCSAKDTRRNLLVRIEFESWPVDTTCPRGVLVQTYGPAGDLAAEEEALTAHYGPVRYKRGSVRLNELTRAEDWGRAKDATWHDCCFHIDPPGCRDIDDAVSLIQQGPDAWTLQIHIAAVASWLASNPELGWKAAAAGQTLYRDGVAVRPMFPPELSEGLLSLLPGEERLVVSLSIPWRRGRGLGQRTFHLQQIRIKESHTYETAAGARWAPLLTEIASDLAGGRVVSDPHEWVEQLMLFYNKAVAEDLRQARVGILRHHAAPDLDRLRRLAALGLPAERLAQRAGEYCAATDASVGHWGLGADAYCHATSPIRRWADAVNQMILRQFLLRESQVEAPVAPPSPPLEQIVELNLRAKAAKAYERDIAFVRALIGPGASKVVEGLVAEEQRIWISAWNRLVRADTGTLSPGTGVIVHIFCDASQRNWKRRLVLRVVPIDSSPLPPL